MRKPGRRLAHSQRSRRASRSPEPRKLCEQQLKDHPPVSASSRCCWDVCPPRRRHPAEWLRNPSEKQGSLGKSRSRSRRTQCGRLRAGGRDAKGPSRRGRPPLHPRVQRHDVLSPPSPPARGPSHSTRCSHGRNAGRTHATGAQRSEPTQTEPVAAVASVFKRCTHARCRAGGAHGVWAESRGPCVCRPARLGWRRINGLSKDETSRNRHLSALLSINLTTRKPVIL